jgi:molybdopterin-guanine dinucleotide biosynthesis protein A
MGSDKALLVMNGKTLLQQTAETCIAAGLPVIVIGREKPAGWKLDVVRFVPDDKPDQGPLAGIATALRQVDGAVAVMACDMPNVTSAAVKWLIAEYKKNSGEHGLIVMSKKGMEPLFSVYAPSAITHIEAALASGERSCHRCIKSGKFHNREISTDFLSTITNVNTPEDLEIASCKSPKGDAERNSTNLRS